MKIMVGKKLYFTFLGDFLHCDISRVEFRTSYVQPLTS